MENLQGDYPETKRVTCKSIHFLFSTFLGGGGLGGSISVIRKNYSMQIHLRPQSIVLAEQITLMLKVPKAI